VIGGGQQVRMGKGEVSWTTGGWTLPCHKTKGERQPAFDVARATRDDPADKGRNIGS